MENDVLVFADKNQQPDMDLAEKALGRKKKLLHKVLAENGITDTVWKFYGATSGWTLQCRQGKKNLFYIQLTQAGFYVWFTLSRQAKIQALEKIQDPALREKIMCAREYAEGSSFKVKVTSENILAEVALLVVVKKGQA